MPISTVQVQLKTALAAVVTDWPIRWTNETWATTVPLSQGLLPVDLNGNPVPFLEAEIIGGVDTADIAPAGNRHSEQQGLFRIYASIPQGQGSAAARVDVIAAAFKRATPYYAPSIGQRLTTMDARVDDGVAQHEDGNRFVRMVSIPWRMDYFS